MINITYALNDAQTAEQIQQDLSVANIRLNHDMLIVLITPDSVEDESVQNAIASAKAEGHISVPLILRKAVLPASISQVPALKQLSGYRKQPLLQFIQQADLGEETRTGNRRLLLYVGAVALAMFIISLGAIGSGVVAFPEDEYATENAIREQQINTIVAPQIEGLRPRTTQDAENFQTTLEAVSNEDLLPFIIGTATAIPESIQATNEARATNAFATDTAATETAGD
ncbi:MAG: hypothetical protein AAFN11_21515 [Chloroflexota bacterium]